MPPRTTRPTPSKAGAAKSSSAKKSATKQSKAASTKSAAKGAKGATRKSTSTRSAVTDPRPAGDSAEHDPVERHRWVVDVIEEDSAAVEVDGRSVTPVPRWMLPVGARQGDVLAVSHRREDVRSVLTIEIDRAATNAAYSASAAQVATGKAASARRDAGGDVSL